MAVIAEKLKLRHKLGALAVVEGRRSTVKDIGFAKHLKQEDTSVKRNWDIGI